MKVFRHAARLSSKPAGHDPDEPAASGSPQVLAPRQLAAVAGGLNPQPLPPRAPTVRD